MANKKKKKKKKKTDDPLKYSPFSPLSSTVNNDPSLTTISTTQTNHQ